MALIATGVASFAAIDNGVTAYLESEATNVYADRFGVVANPSLYTNKLRVIQNGADVLSKFTVTVTTQNVSGTYNSSTGVYTVSAVSSGTLHYVKFDISRPGYPTITKYWTIVVVKESLSLDEVAMGAQNLIKNSDFVDGAASWEGSANTGQFLAPDTGLPTKGMAYSIPEGEVTGEKIDLTQNITFSNILALGSKYTFSFYIKRESTDLSSISIKIGGSSLNVATYAFPAGSLNVWQRLSVTVTIGEALTGFIQPINIYSNANPGAFYLTGLQLERGQIMSDYKVSNQEVGDSIKEINSNLVSLQDAVDPNEMVNTVLSSSGFAGALSSKASQDDYVSLMEAFSVNGQYISSLNEAINNMTTELNQTKNSIDMKFQMSAGVNLIKNSTGFFDKDYWVDSGDVQARTDVTIEEKAVGAAFYSATSGTLSQAITVKPNTTYSFSYWYKKSANKDFVVFISDTNTGNTIAVRAPYEPAATEFSLVTQSFKTAVNQTQLMLFVVLPEGASYISGMMLNEGSVALQWSSHSQEIANSYIKFNLNGIKVISNTSAGAYTQITPSEFAGYAMTVNDSGVSELSRIFTLNGDTTEVYKLKAANSVAIGGASFLYINNSSYEGLALFL